MSEDLHNIDDLFKKALEEHTELSSSAVWDNIDKNLDKKKVVSISKKYNKLKLAAAFLLLFSIGMAMYVLHIRIKDRELVKQNTAAKNLSTQTKNKSEDSISLAEENNTGIEKTKINKELKKEEDNNNAPVTDVTHIKSPSEEKTNDRVTQQKENQLSPANNSSVKLPGKDAEIDLANNKNENSVDVNKEQQGKSTDNFVSIKEKYFKGVPVTYLLKDRFQMLALKPVSQVLQTPGNSTMAALKDNKTASTYKPVHLKRDNMKNANGPLLSATLFFSPDLILKNIKNDHPLFIEDNSHEIKKGEKIRSSSTVGVLIDYSMDKNWKLESGVTFSRRFTDIEPKTIYARPDNNGNINYRFNCSAGYSFVTLKSIGLPPVSGDSIHALRSKNILQYIGVPIMVKYVFNDGRFSVTPGLGISANFLVRGKIETTIPTAAGNESITSNNIQGLKSTYFNGLASIGAQYKLSKALELTFIPTARFALSSINKDAPVKTYLNSIGFEAAIITKL